MRLRHALAREAVFVAATYVAPCVLGAEGSYRPWVDLGVLFGDVQLSGIFSDSKAFVDCTHAVVLGDIANSRRCEQSPQWERKSFPGQSVPAPVTALPNGRVWLLFGVDSGFEGRTAIYFTRAAVGMTPM